MLPEMNDEFIDLDYNVFCKSTKQEKLLITCDIRLFSKQDCNRLSYVNGVIMTRSGPKPNWFIPLTEPELGIFYDLYFFLILVK